MGSSFKKTTYQVTVDPWGGQETKTLFCWDNHTSDITSIYDEDGNLILISSNESNNVFAAINRLITGDGDDMNEEERNKILK